MAVALHHQAVLLHSLIRLLYGDTLPNPHANNIAQQSSMLELRLPFVVLFSSVSSGSSKIAALHVALFRGR